MALINCPECSKQISDQAQSCVNCGVAIASARESSGSGTHLTTTQETSKRLKGHTIFSVLLFFVGLSAQMSSPEVAPGDTVPIWPPTMMALGLFWYLVTRFRIWWHHK